jgi:hypothetical protein
MPLCEMALATEVTIRQVTAAQDATVAAIDEARPSSVLASDVEDRRVICDGPLMHRRRAWATLLAQ